MKKIAFISHGLSTNGIESLLVSIFENINLKKYDVELLMAIDPEVTAAMEPYAKELGIKLIHICDLDSAKKKLIYFKTLYSLFRQNKYDIVHANMDMMNGIILTLAKMSRIKKRICHAHTTQSQYRPGGLLSRLKIMIQKTYKTLMKKLIAFSSTDFLACSAEAGKYFYNSIEPEIIYNGINIDKFTASCTRNAGEHKIVSVGRCSELKNPFFALEIIAALRNLRNDFSYSWVGSGDLLDASKQKAKELDISDIVTFTGARTDVPEILAGSNYFLMPSLSEGLGIALIEAQFAGLNCLASDAIPKLADIGRATFLPLTAPASEWAESLNAMFDAPVPELNSEKAKLFDIRYTVKQLEEIYDK